MAGMPELDAARYATRISLWALFVAGGSFTVTACLLILEIKRWFNEGVRLFMSVMVDAELYGIHGADQNKYIAITVTNRGSAPTTITHMVFYDFPNIFSILIPKRPRFIFIKFKKYWPETMIVPNPGNQILPYVLDPGHNWHGMAVENTELENSIIHRRLYVGVIGSHSNRPFLKLVRKWEKQ